MHVAFYLFVINQLGDCRVVATYRAVMVFRQFNCTESHSQRVICEESSCEEIAFADDVFDCFHCLEASDDSAHGSDDACLFTGWDCILRRRIFEDASVAWSFSWDVGHELAFEADDPCVGEWFLLP